MDGVKRLVRSRWFLSATAVVAVYTLAGFFLAPWLVRHYVPKLAHERLGGQASIGDVRTNPFTFSLEARDIGLQDADGGALVSVQRLFLDFEMKSVFKRAWTFRSIRLDIPQVNAVVLEDGSLNLAALGSPDAPKEPARTQDGSLRLVIEELTIDRGGIDFSDRRQSHPASVTLAPIWLNVRNLTSLPGNDGTQVITATLNDGAELRWSGELGLNPAAGHGEFELRALRVATLWEFVRDELAIETPEGAADLSGRYRFVIGDPEPELAIEDIRVGLAGVSLKLAGEQTPFLEIGEAQVTGGRLDPVRRQVGIEKLKLAGGRVGITADANGRLNLERVVRGDTAQGTPGGTGHATRPWTVAVAEVDLSGLAAEYRERDGLIVSAGDIRAGLGIQVDVGDRVRGGASRIGLTAADVKAAAAGDPEPPVRIARIDLAGGAYQFDTNSLEAETVSAAGGEVVLKRLPDGGINLARLVPVERPRDGGDAGAGRGASEFGFRIGTAEVRDVGLRVYDPAVEPNAPVLKAQGTAVSLRNVDGKSPSTFTAESRVGEGGRFRAAGTLDPTGPTLEADIELSGFDMAALRPYAARAAAVDLASGSLSTRGTLRHGTGADGPRTQYKGGLTLSELRVAERGRDETLVGWQSLSTEDLTFQLGPDRLEAGDIRVQRPVGKFIVEKDRSFNLANLIKPNTPPDAAGRAAEASAPGGAGGFPYGIGRLLVSDGEIDFADLSLMTPFRTRIHKLKGSVSGISSDPRTRAKVRLDGQVESYGTAAVEGELETSSPKAFTDIRVRFRNLEMARLTPYSGEFAGRKIRSGKLTADLRYKVVRSRLEGDNRLVVERLALGEKVQSPEAVDLPLDLAVALLQDANGVIELGLPVRGDLDSPEFSYGALLGKALGNVVTKVVTSPFKAIGSLLPGGREEAYRTIAFAPGRSELSPPEREKLAHLAGALQKRPQLKLTVQGRFQPESDRAELQAARVRRDVARRSGAKGDPGDDAQPPDFADRKARTALEALFADRFGKDALQALRAEVDASSGAGSKPSVRGFFGLGDSGDAPRFAEELFNRLVRAEPVDAGELAGLADARAQAIVAELNRAGRIPPERIDVLPPEPDRAKEPRAELNLTGRG